MDTNPINNSTTYSPVIVNSIIVEQAEEDPRWFKKLSHSKYFKYFKNFLFIILILNLIGWGNMLFFISIGAANKTIPDEHTRKIWMEIAFQVVNTLVFIMIAGYTPWRIRDLYQFYREKHQSKVLQRYKYVNNLILLQMILWSLIINSIVQFALVICIWSMDMNKRPMWLVNIFGGLGLVSGVFAGLAQFILEKRAKKKQKLEQQFVRTF
ncbi:hypothetical protein I4U23_027211 [Adineta vaga]|nr:hypothetical protein I4U23_027211 [Adineta vaga]